MNLFASIQEAVEPLLDGVEPFSIPTYVSADTVLPFMASGWLIAQPCLVATWFWTSGMPRWLAVILACGIGFVLAVPFGLGSSNGILAVFLNAYESGGGVNGLLQRILLSQISLAIAVAEVYCWRKFSKRARRLKEESKLKAYWPLGVLGIPIIAWGFCLLTNEPTYVSFGFVEQMVIPSVLFLVALSLLNVQGQIVKTIGIITCTVILFSLILTTISVLNDTRFFASQFIGDFSSSAFICLKHFGQHLCGMLTCSVLLVAGLLLMRRAGYRIDLDLNTTKWFYLVFQT